MKILSFENKFFKFKNRAIEIAAVCLVLLLAASGCAFAAPKRIVSTSPVGTEIICALGLEEELIAVSSYCDYPPSVKSKPKVGGYKGINLETIIAEKVDLLVISDIDTGMTGKLNRLGIKYAVVYQDSLENICKSIEQIGAVCDKKSAAAKITSDIKRQISGISSKIKAQAKDCPRVLLCCSREISEPHIKNFYAASDKTFYGDIIRLAGGECALKYKGMQYMRISAEGLIAINPDVIIDLVPDLGVSYNVHGGGQKQPFTKRQLEHQWCEMKDTNAARNNRAVVLTDFVYVRPGPRVAQILKGFAKAIHPEIELD